MEAIAWSAAVSSLVLGPLTGRADADWHKAPPGKWSPAQIVHHLALGLEYSQRTLASRATRPAPQPDREAVTRQFREAVDGLLALERELLPARAADLFARHPALGDLTLPEWLRFHEWHCRHHAKQIR